MKYLFYTGSYAPADAPGICLYEFDTEKKTFHRKKEFTGVSHPSYLLPHPNGEVLYCVEELAPTGRITALSTDGEKLCSVSSGGAHPCHLSFGKNNAYLFAANYTSGSLAMLRLTDGGKHLELTDLMQHHGKGAHPDRQERAHVHFSQEIGQLLYACDLGIDQIISYTIDEQCHRLTKTGSVTLPPGTGPRHFTAVGRFLYVIAELTGDVFVFERTENALVPLQQISSLASGFTAENTGAAIKCSESRRFLLVSNRGADTITSFCIRPDGTLEKTDIADCGGKHPRDFEVFGTTLIIANQSSDLLTAMMLDEITGALTLLSHCAENVSSPSMICPYQMVDKPR